MAALLKTQQLTYTTCTPSQEHHVDPAQNTTQLQQALIAPEFITLVAQAMQHMKQLTRSDCKQSAQGITDHPEYKVPMDWSFDSMNMHQNK